MLTFNELKEIEPYYIEKINTYVFKHDITINFTLDVGANIIARNIIARNINAWNIDVLDIDAKNIDAKNIDANNIDAWDINANNIDAGDIKYWAVCIARNSFKCKSVKGRRENSIHKCLDQEIEFIKD